MKAYCDGEALIEDIILFGFLLCDFPHFFKAQLLFLVAPLLFLDQLEYFHKTIDRIMKFEAPTHQLLEVHNTGSLIGRLQFLYLRLELFVIVHHIHGAHQFSHGMYRLAPVLRDDGQSFILVKLLMVVLTLHVAQRGGEVPKLDLAVDLLVIIDPMPLPLELFPNSSCLPVCVLENLQ